MAASPKLHNDVFFKEQAKTDLTVNTVNHPALSRVKQKLDQAQGINTDNPSMYSRMHHRNNRS